MIWIAVFIVSLIAEALTVALVSVWFCIGSVLAFLTERMGFGLTTQVLVFLISSIILLLLTKPFVQRFLVKKVEPTNADALIGETAKVVTHINNREEIGEVKLRNAIYMARSLEDMEIRVGELVKVERIEGVKLFVRQEKTENEITGN